MPSTGRRGGDVTWIETISSFEELDAADEAASGTGLPIAATLSFDTAGHTMMGIHPSDLGRWWLGHRRLPRSGPTVGSALEMLWLRPMPSARWPGCPDHHQSQLWDPVVPIRGGLTYRST